MIRNITLGKMNNIRKSIILNVLASISNLIPFIALAKIVETLFLNRGADSIDTVSYTHLRCKGAKGKSYRTSQQGLPVCNEDA